MRFIRGDSLQEAIERFHASGGNNSDSSERALELRKLLGRFLDVCNAIAYAHSRGVLHRDLKPGNIMLGKYGETLVVDWGLAKTLDQSEIQIESSQGPVVPSVGGGSAPTQMGSAIGTPRYMSPEQAAGRLDLLGSASDVYGLGATLYSVLTGRAPIEGDETGVILKRVEQGEFRPPRAIRPELDRALEAICLRAMALKPADRYKSPRELADDIEHWLADEPVAAYRDPLLSRLARTSRRHKAATASIAALAIASIVALIVGNILLGREQLRTEDQRKKAVTARKETDEKNRQLEQSNAQIQKEKRQTARQLALSYIERGVNELERGDQGQGFAILGQAYHTASNAPDVRGSVCSLLGAWDFDLTRVLKHDNMVHAVAFNPDGTKIATASDDHTARLWDVATGKPLATPLKHEGNVTAVAFSPDGTKIATASDDHTAQLWRVPRSFRDDLAWIAAYVSVVSGWKEDADQTLRPTTSQEAEAAWAEVTKSADGLDYRSRALNQGRRALHECDAAENEAQNRWFAAAFHLRWLSNLEPDNAEWKQRLAVAEKNCKTQQAKSGPAPRLEKSPPEHN